MKTQIQTQQIYYTGLSTERADYAGYDDVIFHETDTGKDYTYDKATQAWVEIKEEPAGGGDVMVVTVTATSDGQGSSTYSTETSIDDVIDAIENGTPVVYYLYMELEGGMAIVQVNSFAVQAVPTLNAAVIQIIPAGDSLSIMSLYHTEDGISEQAPSVGD